MLHSQHPTVVLASRCRICNIGLLRGKRMRHFRQTEGLPAFGCRICNNGSSQRERMLRFQHPQGFFVSGCRICSNGFLPRERALRFRQTRVLPASGCRICSIGFRSKKRVLRFRQPSRRPFRVRPSSVRAHPRAPPPSVPAATSLASRRPPRACRGRSCCGAARMSPACPPCNARITELPCIRSFAAVPVARRTKLVAFVVWQPALPA